MLIEGWNVGRQGNLPRRRVTLLKQRMEAAGDSADNSNIR